MCDSVLRDKIIAKVNALTAANAMFTAWDVTRLLRQDGEWARHNEVRAEVHILFEDGDMGQNYLRTNVCIDSSRNTYAHVFHNNIDNPSNYDANGLQTTPTGNVSATPTAAVPTASPISPACGLPLPVASSTDPDILTTDSRGRILIRKWVVRQLGLRPGDAVGVWLGGIGDLCISVDKVGKWAIGCRMYLVDKYYEIRIKPSLWNYLGSAFKTDFSSSGDTLFVRPA